jgi:chorismate synthase
MNSLGKLFRLTSFGESHGPAIGGVIDGFPSNIEIDLKAVQNELDRRRPGQSAIVTQRKEPDTVEFLSGIEQGKSTGASIGFIIKNQNQKSKDYSHLEEVFRPSHADFTYDAKYGIRSVAGGGRSSARETANWVVAGALAKQLLERMNISARAYVSQVGAVRMETVPQWDVIENNPVRCACPKTAESMENLIREVRKDGDTIGGVVSCKISGVPAGLGEPIFDKLHADLAKYMMTINAAKGFEYGSGFSGVTMKGSEHNDKFKNDAGNIVTESNYSGGIQGGISNGMDIDFKVAFKPVATLIQKQESINKKGEKVELDGKGRHDPCVVPRAVPIVEALAYMLILDHYLLHKSRTI